MIPMVKPAANSKKYKAGLTSENPPDPLEFSWSMMSLLII